MAEDFVINVDFAVLRREDGSPRTLLAWGDRVRVLDRTATKVEVEVTDFKEQPDGSSWAVAASGFLKRKLRVDGADRQVVLPEDDVRVLQAHFDELREQAELEIRGQGRSLDPDDIDFVEQAADLLAALQLWAEAQDRTEDDVREVVEAASGTMLKNIATELHEGGGDDALKASRRLEGIAYSPSGRLSDVFKFAQKAVPPSSANSPLWDEDQ